MAGNKSHLVPHPDVKSKGKNGGNFNWLLSRVIDLLGLQIERDANDQNMACRPEQSQKWRF